MIRKIFKSIRRVKQAAYLATLRKQLDRLDRDYAQAEGPDRRDLATRIRAKQAAIGRAQQALAALAVALRLLPAGCAPAPPPTGALPPAGGAPHAALEAPRATPPPLTPWIPCLAMKFMPGGLALTIGCQHSTGRCKGRGTRVISSSSYPR